MFGLIFECVWFDIMSFAGQSLVEQMTLKGPGSTKCCVDLGSFRGGQVCACWRASTSARGTMLCVGS